MSLPAAFKKVTEARPGAERLAREAQLQRLVAAVAEAQAGSRVVKWGAREHRLVPLDLWQAVVTAAGPS
jgi:hypothetical protein